MPNYLKKRGSKFHFQKRVPKDFQKLFPKKLIQIPLRTDSKIVATQRAGNLNLLIEEFLINLLDLNEHQRMEKFKSMVQLAKFSGFQLRPREEIVQRDTLPELVNRINMADKAINRATKAIIMGDEHETGLTVSEALEEYLEHEKGNLKGKSENQIRKWENPRKKAINNFIAVIEDKSLEDITRKDVLEFRGWWLERILKEDLTANSANKDFGFMKIVLQQAADNHLDIDLPVDDLFRNMRLKKTEKTKRLPFSSAFIQDTLLNKAAINLNEEAHLLIFAMSDTGARISELTGLEEKDIVLDADIPHIKIRPNQIRTLKTAQSERDIPLVGASLYAFQTLNGPFKLYHGKPDLVSNTINKYFRAKNILPSKDYSLYSLRHSFEDRLTTVEPPDKVQAALMGHKYTRPRYGHGPSLEQKRAWLEKIAFNVQD